MSGTPAGTVVVRAADLRFHGDAAVAAGDCGLRSGELAVFCRPVAAAPAVVRRDGSVLAGGWLPDLARLGELERHLGDGVIEAIVAATLEAGVKVNHLSYIGDAHVGANSNIGAGTITCNYDGFSKHQTTIGAGAFVGTNSSLVAPVKIGSGAYIGSGSVITREVPDDALAVERGEQTNREGGAKRYRELKTRGKTPKTS